MDWVNIAALVLALLVGVILHEIAHGRVAEYFGDPTAREAGRITLNPIKHIDPYLTLLLPGLLIAFSSPIVFGGAKPVPINPARLRNPRGDMMWVALAGPLVNFLLAALSALFLWVMSHWLRGAEGVTGGFLLQFSLLLGVNALFINLVLGIFNLFPVPPLDGSRIVLRLLPLKWLPFWLRLERFGLLLVLLLIISGALGFVFKPLSQALAWYLQYLFG